MRIVIKYIFIQAFIFFFVVAYSQNDTLHLNNPSFEDHPRPHTAPKGWHDCGLPGETPPDTQPDPYFEVSQKAYDGNTYLGLVVRDDETWESVAQRLSQPLDGNKCYEFSLFLARSERYISLAPKSDEKANYTTPAKIRIYGGFGYCDKKFLLGETKVVINHRWLEFKFKFEPEDNYSHILIEAFFQTPSLFPYNGNVLVDNASPIVEVPCDDVPIPEETPADYAVKSPDKPPVKPPTTPSAEVEKRSIPVIPSPVVPETTRKKKEVLLGGIKAKELKTGQTIRIENLYFDADSFKVSKNSYPALEELHLFLDANDKVIIEIGGHTNSLPPHDYADKLSTDRAKSVADYLGSKGIASSRLKFKGYGKRQLLDSSKTPRARKRNQRVEIKILSTEG